MTSDLNSLDALVCIIRPSDTQIETMKRCTIMFIWFEHVAFAAGWEIYIIVGRCLPDWKLACLTRLCIPIQTARIRLALLWKLLSTESCPSMSFIKVLLWEKLLLNIQLVHVRKVTSIYNYISIYLNHSIHWFSIICVLYDESLKYAYLTYELKICFR